MWKCSPKEMGKIFCSIFFKNIFPLKHTVKSTGNLISVISESQPISSTPQLGVWNFDLGWEFTPIFFKDLGISPTNFFTFVNFHPSKIHIFKIFNHYYYHFLYIFYKLWLQNRKNFPAWRQGHIFYTHILNDIIFKTARRRRKKNVIFFHP